MAIVHSKLNFMMSFPIFSRRDAAYNCCSLIRSPFRPGHNIPSHTRGGVEFSRLSEVTKKRGFRPAARCSALPTTRRVRDQLLRVW